MKSPNNPVDEVHRLDAMRSLKILDTAPETEFGDIVSIGQRLFGVPICLISLVDKDRQWFKARIGIDAQETERCISFCGHAILGRDALIVLDARQDERFHDNPLVTGEPHVRFYAGASLWLPSGYPVGTLCIISPEPRDVFGDRENEYLSMLARTAMTAISLRALRAELDSTRANADQYWSILRGLTQPVALLDTQGCIEACNRAFAALCPVKPPDGVFLNAALAIPDCEWTPGSMNPARDDACDIAPPNSGIVLHIRRRVAGFVVTAG
jgi:GAF domain-containing protein